MDAAPDLRLISRVGIGLDNVDLAAARRRGIQGTYTPDAPSPAGAELTTCYACHAPTPTAGGLATGAGHLDEAIDPVLHRELQLRGGHGGPQRRAHRRADHLAAT